MNKSIFLAALLASLALILVIIFYLNPPGGVACTLEAKICPDGSAVGRNSSNSCEFDPCPPVENDSKRYISTDVDQCKVINFLCASGTAPFFDEAGCGCEAIDSSSSEHFCTAESRNADACIEIYQPVCGWFDADKVQCIRYPCAQTFSNSCFSCLNEDVLYWTTGECPK